MWLTYQLLAILYKKSVSRDKLSVKIQYWLFIKLIIYCTTLITIKMDYQYNTSTGYQIFYGLVGALAIVFALVIFNSSVNSAPAPVLIIPFLLVASGLLIIVNLFKRKVTINDLSIKYSWVFKTSEIAFNDVKGYRINEKVINIETTRIGSANIRIGDYDSISDSNGLKDWLITNFKDLDQEEFEGEKQGILQDSSLGATKEDREKLFNKMRQYNIYYSIPSSILFVGVALLHQSSFYFSCLLLIYPLIGIALMSFSKGLIIIFAKKSSAYSSIGIGMVFSVAALIVESFLDNKILSFDNGWVPFISISVIIFIALLFLGLKRSHPAVAGQLIFALLIAVGYGFGSTLGINTIFDKSKPEMYKAAVTDHYITHGKNTSYHLKLSEWGQHQDSDNITVSRSLYYNVNVGDSLNVYEKKGMLNIPWYYISQ